MPFHVENTLRSQRGLSLPAVLLILMVTSAISTLLVRLSTHNLADVKINQSSNVIYFAAEGAVSKQIGEMSVLNSLWEQKVNLATVPSGYTEFSPALFASTNGIPSCTGTACQRNMYPTGGGLIKNIGPVGSDGDTVDGSYSISQQLNPADVPEADLSLSGVKAWTQVERLDESTPGAAMVGGSLTNSISEGGNAKTGRYRITGVAIQKVKGRNGYATVVAIVEMPMS